MKIVSIITTLDNKVESIKSFQFFEQGLMTRLAPSINDNNMKEAKKAFINAVKHCSMILDEEIESYIQEGVFEGDNGYTVSIVISDLE